MDGNFYRKTFTGSGASRLERQRTRASAVGRATPDCLNLHGSPEDKIHGAIVDRDSRERGAYRTVLHRFLPFTVVDVIHSVAAIPSIAVYASVVSIPGIAVRASWPLDAREDNLIRRGGRSRSTP